MIVILSRNTQKQMLTKLSQLLVEDNVIAIKDCIVILFRKTQKQMLTKLSQLEVEEDVMVIMFVVETTYFEAFST